MFCSLCSLSHRLTAGLGALLAGLLLATAFVLEYGLNWPPCTLCWWQRYGLMVSVVAGLIAWLSPNHARGLLWLIAAGFFASGGLGFFHAGVEAGWWTFESGCTTGLSTDGSLEDLKAAILGAPVIRCDEPFALIFGISLAAWNALFSTLIGLLLLAKAIMKPAS